MKIKYFTPLILFFFLTVLFTRISPKTTPEQFRQFVSFIISFIFIYITAAMQMLKHKEPIIKIGNKMPYLAPYFMFALPVVIFTAIFIPHHLEIITGFILYFLLATLTYFSVVIIIINDLKKAIHIQKRNSKNSKVQYKLLLINPVNHNKSGLTNNISSTFPPLGLGIIAALTPDDFKIKIIDENIKKFEYEKADLVGITAFTSSAPRAYELAKIYKQKNIPVIMGGIHASMESAEALKYVDSIVIGEAESVWAELITDFKNNRLQQKYFGNHDDLNNCVIPRRDLFSNKYLFNTIQTSRGCPMDCSFCSVSAFNGKKYRQRPVNDVLGELEKIEGKYIFFIDDNITGYGEKCENRAIKLFKGMADRKLNKIWFAQASINFGLNKNLLYWAARSGCKMVFLGLESADPDELLIMDKKINLKHKYDIAFKNINKAGIAVLGAFIYGSDNETAKSMRRKTDYILKHRIDVIQSTILTPLPGTRLFKQFKEENRLIAHKFPDDWQKFDMSELTYKLKKIEKEKFVDIMNSRINKFYSRRNMFKTFIKTLIHTKSLETALWAYNSNSNYRNISLKKE